jgi:predicted acyltransferase (DUF342 family)
MPFVDNKQAEPASECFLVTADTLVQSVLLRYGALRKDKVQARAYNAGKSVQGDNSKPSAPVKTAVA